MGEFLLEWNDINMGLDGSLNGIPIPRSQHSQTYSRIDLSSNYYQNYDHGSPSHRPPLVPPNSLVNSGSGYISSQFGFPIDQQRYVLSPSDSPLMPNSNSDMDVEIKMEPLEDLLDISGMINTNSNLHNQEDNLLDNVSLDDLLMTDEMESSTTCLDPQHSSPAAMATVHPDDVLGMTRNEANINHYHSTFSSSINVPVKTENYSFGYSGSSFPPVGQCWKDPFLNMSVPNHSLGLYQNQLEIVKEGSPHSSRVSPAGLNHNIIEQIDQQSFNNNEQLFSQGESNSNSALRELLVNSPSISHGNQVPPQSSHSPFQNIAEQELSIGKSVPGPPSFLLHNQSLFSSRLSSSAPVNDFSIDKIWQRREPRQHLISTGSLVGLEEAGGSTSSISTGGGILSPPPHDLSIDEGIDSDDDSDIEHYDSDSDNDSIMSEEMSSMGHGTKKERHFWQYNVQAKGPKGQRVNIIQNDTDPHQLCKIMDPVFSPMCSIQGIKHSGKARRGDGNDLTPSPKKLVSIGLELEKLNKKINEMTPVSELPSTVRSKSRKEKNKLASRACRLKKKAQHEANKIKLYGLEQEHKSLLSLIGKVKDDLVKKVDFGQHDVVGDRNEGPLNFRSHHNEAIPHLQQHLTTQIEKAAKFRTKQRIAGHTTEFVNKVIENSRNGNPSGGLDELAQTFVKSNLSPGEVLPDHGLFT